ncbi:Polyamine oxidase 5 [Hibiscus syriacus]|uniref:Polyamine oxidase 5 n=1 Tax=Hibiscus syriacus TaxID=106335 RepID=A0A6A2Z6D5_HIBSY|nr:Polyamine oxidase 5 [Hibiscus syriacus]
MEEEEERANEESGAGNDDSPELKRRREAKTVELDNGVSAWLSIDEEGCKTDAMSELLKLVDDSAERTSSSCSTASYGVKVRFSENPYSSALIFQSSSSYVTINGNEESCGSSFSDSESSVMASVDMRGIVNWNVNAVSGLEEIRGWMEEDDGSAWGTSEGETRCEWNEDQLARFLGEECLF